MSWSFLPKVLHRHCCILPLLPNPRCLVSKSNTCRFVHRTINGHINVPVSVEALKLPWSKNLPNSKPCCVTKNHWVFQHHQFIKTDSLGDNLGQVHLFPSATTFSTPSSSWLSTHHGSLARKAFSTTSRRLYTSDGSKKASPPHDTVLVSLQRLEDSLRYHGYSTIRIGFVASVILGIAIYIFRESIRENVADEVSQVATRSLEDRLVADKAEEFAKGLLNALLKDEPMHLLASQFVVEVLQRPETKQAMKALVMGVLQDPNTKAQLTATVKQVIITALNEEDTRDYIKSTIRVILSDQETRHAVINLLRYVSNESETRKLTATFFRDVLKSDVVVDQATQLGKQVTNSIISDPALQEKTGDSLWSAMKYSITPRWFASSPSAPSEDDAEEEEEGDQDNAAYDEKVKGPSSLEADEESVLGG